MNLKGESVKKILSLTVSAAVLFSSSWCFANWADSLRPTRWEFRTGYAYQYTNSKRPTNFEIIPFFPGASVPIGDAAGSGWLHGRWEWAPELFLATIIHPFTRPVVGVTPLQFRYVFEPKCRFHPYLFGGAGILYGDFDRRETGHRLNFNPQFGAGFYYALNDSASLILEYRHIHISNAGMDERNSGLNTHTFLAGLSVKR